MINFSQIYEGWRNKLIPPSDMRLTIQNVRHERLAICAECPLHSKNHDVPLRPDDHCTECGCNLEAKTSCLSCKCPKDKCMDVVASIEEENQLKASAYGQER